MSFSFCEAIDLVFYAGAVPGPYAFDTAGIHGTAVKSRLKDIVNGRIGIGDPAASLLFGFGCIQIRKTDDLVVAFLFFHLSIVQASSVNPGRGTRFEAIAVKAK